jgi:hypothetical protein
MKRKIFLCILVLSGMAFSQGTRIDNFTQSTSSSLALGLTVMVPLASPAVNFCGYPATIVSGVCTNKVTTYTDVTLATPCISTQQIVLAGTSSCTSAGDGQGNWGVWVPPGTYTYTLTISGVSYGPYTVTAGLNNPVKNLNNIFEAVGYAGADASIKINACLTDVIAAGGGTCDATGLNGTQTISQQINVGSRSLPSGQWATLLLPPSGVWSSTMSNASGCLIKQFNQSSLLGTATGQGIQLVIAAQSGANLASVYCTDDAPTSGGSYLRASGFMARAFSGATIGRAVVEIRKLFDNSVISNISAVDAVAGSKALWVWQTGYGALIQNVSAEGNSAAIPCTIGNTNALEATAATQATNFLSLSCVHPGDGLNAAVIAEGSTWTYSNNIVGLYLEGLYPTDTTTAALAITNSGSASGANNISGVRLGSDNVGATRYVVDIASGAKINIYGVSGSNANFINDHNGSGTTIVGSVNGTIAGYSTEKSYLRQSVIYSGTSTANQYFDFSQGGGVALTTGNVVAADEPRWMLKSTATSGGASRSYVTMCDGNTDCMEMAFTADGAQNPFEIYPWTAGTRGSKVFGVDNAGLTTLTTAKIGAGATVTSSGAGGTMAATIASGTATMTTALIGAGACGTTVTVGATGTVTTDAISFAYNASVAANPGVLIINRWPTANNVNFNYCNPTAAGVTPSAATLNWSVVR